MSVTRRSIRATAVAVVLSIAVGGCSGLEFEQDRRLTFDSPTSDKLTHLPVTLSWTMQAPAGSYTFGVFVDHQPIKVGHNIYSVLPKGTRPTAALLAEANVYVTDADHVTLRIIPDLSYDRSSRQRHTATVILLDRAGNRVNESSWTRSFDLPRSGT